MHYIICTIILLLSTVRLPLLAQQTTIKGKVTDATSGDPVPFANIFFKGTNIGTTTDFEGNYKINTTRPSDSLVASFIGYQPKAKAVAKGVEQTINFQLSELTIGLDEVVIRPGENPAWEIMRRVIDHKYINDKKNLKAYQYEAYTKLEIDIDNISGKFKKRKAAQKILAAIDSLDKISGEDGKPIIPLFISESVSDVYYRSAPQLKKEVVKHSRVRGVGIEDGSLVSQIVGASFQEYNFYNNWLNILSKQFASPISDYWQLHYEYELLDSVMVGKKLAYLIKFDPKRAQDAAFKGQMWINKEDYALLRIEARTSKSTDINFVEKISIQQELVRTPTGAYMPQKNRILVDFADLSDSWAGILAKFYTSYKNIEVNKPKPPVFFDRDIEVLETSPTQEDSTWQGLRHDSLTLDEIKAFHIIDTISNVPVIKTYVEIANILINGYKRIGKIDFGPVLFTYAFNSVEGQRFRLGARTNYHWSKKWTLDAAAAYGTLDEKWKYHLGVERILSRKHWTVAGLQTKYDLEQLGLIDNSIFDNLLFMTFARFGNLASSRPFYQHATRLYYQQELYKGLSIKLAGQYKDFYPVRDVFNFSYYSDLTPPNKGSGITRDHFNTTELSVELRYGRDELFIQNENSRISLGPDKYPVFILKYDRGIKGIFNSDFNYHKLSGTVIQYVNYGLIGNGRFVLNAGLVPTIVPYPILRAHMGNQTPFMTLSNYNLMRYFEFISDQFISLNYQHYFEGFLLNQVPAIKRLKWRLVAHGNILYGHVANNKIDIIPPDPITNSNQFQSLGQAPYAEAGYGVENIFKFLRVDFVHRLTYLNKPKIRPFGVMVSAQFKM
jgi:hypothetical protein